jgi:hypothetical protein
LNLAQATEREHDRCDSLSLLVAACGAYAARDGFGFARNSAAATTTFDVFYWLQVTNFDVPPFDPAPRGLDHIDVYFWIHAQTASPIIS